MLVLGFLASGALVACGGDDADEPESTTAEEPALDATAFRECILSDSLDYDETDSPEPELAELSAEAEHTEAVKRNKGLVEFYAFDDPTAAEDFVGEFEATLDNVAERLVDENAGLDPVEPTVEVHESVVVGVVPFSKKESELSEEVASDVSDCAEEQIGSS